MLAFWNMFRQQNFMSVITHSTKIRIKTFFYISNFSSHRKEAIDMLKSLALSLEKLPSKLRDSESMQPLI